MIVSVKNLKKYFAKQVALDGISFEIDKGEIFGFLGPSGSGKTTTINILTGQLSDDGGSAMIFDKKPEALTSDDFAQLGIVSDQTGFYEKLTLEKNLLAYAKLWDVPKKRVQELMETVGIADSAKKPAEKLSTGMKQRMLLARALLNKPKLLFLDEPTSGLDPATSRVIHQLLLELKEQGTTIFLTTHDMTEATLLCDRVALLSQGKLVEIGRPDDLVRKYNQKKQVQLIYIDGRNQQLSFEELVLISDIESLESIHSCEPTLEDIFITLTGGKLNV
ncbi:ABC transporter ATP-binding protein [Streptococcus dentiloxodontae]